MKYLIEVSVQVDKSTGFNSQFTEEQLDATVREHFKRMFETLEKAAPLKYNYVVEEIK